ncbi:MAG: type II toxin-antitoxin system Phd/YefM family antitoxin [Alphaproteobacteria bacterium]|jgi:antitoxin YefM|nr:type II toxin-antitoxin system Phd/YefM family antitoxin [Alphaproteobacteria bacterium]MBT5828542.1 type II toxin-antitoxin system Phd/YefM family antitoxin [Alphaproteobacteria bacterium]
MNIYNSTTARQNFFKLMSEVSTTHNPAIITGKKNNVVMISEEDYNAMQETLSLLAIPGMRKSIKEGMETKLEDCDKKLDW